jgi:hypothetical protein
MEKGGFAGAVTAEENQNLAALELEAQMVERRKTAETFGQKAGFESSASAR